jgi:hypothetical protein
MRISQRIGLHRDNISGLGPFDCEMRRRVWKQVLIMDLTAAELVGSLPSHPYLLNWWRSSKPLNVDDSELRPGMATLPQERQGATEMIFCLLRYEFCTLLRTEAPSGTDTKVHLYNLDKPLHTLAQRDAFLDRYEERLETLYLRFCDPINPLHALTNLTARSTLIGLRLKAHHPRQYPDGGASLPKEERDKLFQSSLKALQYDNLAFSTPQLKRFLWDLRCYFPYHALVYLLIEAKVRRVGQEADSFWGELEMVYKHRPEFLRRKQVIHSAIALLALQAWEAREAELKRLNVPLQRPEFIVSLYKSAECARGTSTKHFPPSRSGPSAGLFGVGSEQPIGVSVLPDQQTSSGKRSEELPVSVDEFSSQQVTEGVVDWAQWDSLLSNSMSGLDFPLGSADFDSMIMCEQ